MKILEKIKEYQVKEREIRAKIDELYEESEANYRELEIAYIQDTEFKDMIVKDIENMFGENPTLDKVKQKKLWKYFMGKRNLMITRDLSGKISTKDCLQLLGIKYNYSELPQDDGWKELSVYTNVSAILGDRANQEFSY